MSIIGYSTCRIQFIPNNKQIPERNYSERSIVEIRQFDNITDYSLRAIDVENNNTEIFNFPIRDPDKYQLGIFAHEPDEINGSNGIYRLWLSKDSRTPFHETIQAILEILFPDESTETTSEYTHTSSFSNKSDERREPPIRDPISCDPKDILIDVRNLSRFIMQGNSDEAARMAKQFASQGIRFQLNPLQQFQNEEEFRILVQFDGNEYGIDQNGGTIPVNVFPSTTVRELRAAFEIAYHYCPTSQYFFVNGNLVHDNCTMRDLDVGPNSLFVLFLIAYPKQFKTDGPWNCSSCKTQNQQDNLKCRLCLASRTE